MQTVLQATIHICYIREFDSFERRNRMQNCVMLGFIVHVSLVIAFLCIRPIDCLPPRPPTDNMIVEYWQAPVVRKILDVVENDVVENIDQVQDAGKPAARAASAADADASGSANQRPTNRTRDLQPSSATSGSISAGQEARLEKRSSVHSDQAISISPKEAVPVPFGLPLELQDGSNAAVLGSDKVRQDGGGSVDDSDASSGSYWEGGSGVDSGAGNKGGGASEPRNGRKGLINIGPYRNHLLYRLSQVFRAKSDAELVLLLEVNRDGTVRRADLLSSTEGKRFNRRFIELVQDQTFDPLPQELKGDFLPFKITLSSVGN